MPKILIIVPNLHGSMRLLGDLLNHIGSDFDISLIIEQNKDTILQDVQRKKLKIQYVDKNIRIYKWINLFFMIYRKAPQVDLLISWAELTSTYITALVGFIAKRPVIGWVHANLTVVFKLKQRPAFLHIPIMKFIYPRLKAIIGVSNGVAIDLIEKFNFKNVYTVTNYVDISRILTNSTQTLPEYYHSLFSKPVVINVGALSFQKNHELLIKSCNHLWAIGYDFNLIIAGEGELLFDLIKLTNQLGVTEKVHFLRYLQNPYPLMVASTIFALSSRWEGLPLVLIEALALGLPIVSTDCCNGPSEVLAKGEFGILIPPGSEEDLSKAIERLLINRDLRFRFIRNGIARSLQYDIKRAVGEIEKMLIAMLSL